VSAVALDRAAAHAAAEGVRVNWQREDLLTWDPGPERFDLVTAEFMHLPPADLQSLHDRLAAAVRPGGTMLIVAHHPDDLRVNAGRTRHVSLFPSAEELAASLDPGSWEIVVADAISRQATDLDGQPVTLKDTVLRAARRGV
jgi:trans-aconitate methyltransferase